MNKNDIILKDITKEAIREVFKYIIKIDVNDFEFLDIEFQKIEERKADILVKSNDKIIHIEFQTKSDKNMIFRMLRYYSEIKFLYPNMEVYQYVIYIGKYQTSMKYILNEHNINFNYELIDMKKIDCNEFLESENPEAVVVSILCDFQDKNEREVIRKIIERLLKITKNENEFRKCFSILEELSVNRNLQQILKEEEMALQYLTWEDLPSYQVGIEKGIEAGIQKGIEAGIQKGIQKAKEETIQKMIQIGMNDEMILKIVDINEIQLKQLKEKYANS